jgi:AcrR family transcriptional regulator
MAYSISDEQILEAALAEIAREGYAGVTTRRIAEAAGINEVTLFRRFGNKKNLLVAAVEKEAEEFTASGINYTGDLEADMLRIVQFYHDLAQNRGQVMVMLLSEVPRQPELLEVMQTPFSIIRKIGALIERYQREGALVQEPPLHAFAALAGPLFVGGIFGFVQPDLSDLTPDPAELVARFLNGHGVR